MRAGHVGSFLWLRAGRWYVSFAMDDWKLEYANSVLTKERWLHIGPLCVVYQPW